MKSFIPVIILIMSFTTIGWTQDIACSAERYTDDVFEDLQMTTITYGANINSLGLSQDLCMDIYEPAVDPAPLRPLILLAHGGSFIFGNKSQMEPYCQLFAKKGYVAATVQYRLWSLLNGFPDAEEVTATSIGALQDMKAAIRYFYKQAQEGNPYRIDTTKIFIGGYSAGAIAAVGVAYLDADDDIPANIQGQIDAQGGLTGMSGNQGYASDVIGLMSLSGGITDVNWINEGDIPVIAMHGTADATVPYTSGLANNLVIIEGSKNIDDRMIALGIEHYLHSVPDGGHTDIYTDDIYAGDRNIFATEGLAFFKNMICLLDKVGDITQVKDWTKMSPNPATEFTRLSWDNTNFKSIKIYNLLGQEINSFKSADLSLEINTFGLSKGTYFIQILHGLDQKYIEIKKLIIE